MNEQNVGTVSQVIGPVLDVKFADGQLPNLLNALEVDNHGETIIAEVAQHIGDNTARCIAMSSTDGLVRGAKAVNTGGSIRVPVGEETLGRMFNLLGQPIDNGEPIKTEENWEIHRPAPSFEEQEGAVNILETGIKVVDLICPYAKGGKIGLFGEQHILILAVTEILRHRQTRQCDTHTCSWRLVHLTVNQSSLVDNSTFFHFIVKVISLTGTFSNTCKN